MLYRFATTKKFDKEYARLSQNDRKIVDSVVSMILEGIPLPEKYHDHPLKGNLKKFSGLSCKARPCTDLWQRRRCYDYNCLSY